MMTLMCYHGHQTVQEQLSVIGMRLSAQLQTDKALQDAYVQWCEGEPMSPDACEHISSILWPWVQDAVCSLIAATKLTPAAISAQLDLPEPQIAHWLAHGSSVRKSIKQQLVQYRIQGNYPAAKKALRSLCGVHSEAHGERGREPGKEMCRASDEPNLSLHGFMWISSLLYHGNCKGSIAAKGSGSNSYSLTTTCARCPHSHPHPRPHPRPHPHPHWR